MPHKVFLALRPSKGRQSGFSLVEVLISIVILSFGLLGMVGLQASSIKANREARLQSVGTTFAKELGEMMRGNLVESSKPTATNPYLVAAAGAAMAPATRSYCLAVGQTCATTAAIANAQLTDWLARVSAELPGARVRVCYDSQPFDGSGDPQWACTDSSPNGTIMIKIGWTRASTNSASKDVDQATAATSMPAVIIPIDPANPS